MIVNDLIILESIWIYNWTLRSHRSVSFQFSAMCDTFRSMSLMLLLLICKTMQLRVRCWKWYYNIHIYTYNQKKGILTIAWLELDSRRGVAPIHATQPLSDATAREDLPEWLSMFSSYLTVSGFMIGHSAVIAVYLSTSPQCVTHLEAWVWCFSC